MIDDIKIGFKVGVADLLKEDTELIFDFFCFEEEVKLIFLVFREHTVDELLELFWTCGNGHFVDS
jgi:hypothetical protein